jgi:RNA polymerase sigma factor (TIGR02999 family)
VNDPAPVTSMLSHLSAGDDGALERLVPLVYDELRSIARAKLRREAPGHTLNTTALVHEAYLRLVGIDGVEWADRAHFFAVCARVMRRVLLDYADRVRAKKRGGARPDLPLVEGVVATDGGPTAVDLVDLDRALERLESLDERQCRVVECRFFAGLSVDETAEALSISPATVKREWATARAWLNRELGA